MILKILLSFFQLKQNLILINSEKGIIVMEHFPPTVL